MQHTHSPQFLKKRKFMLMLPILTLPFLTLLFWILGGGKGNAQDDQPRQAGLNLQLPEPKLADESRENKLSFYNKAQEDSIQLRQEMRNDPYYRNGLDTLTIPKNFSNQSMEPSFQKLSQSPYYPAGSTEPNEAKIYERLDALNKAIEADSEITTPAVVVSDPSHPNRNAEFSSDVDRLENMMQFMNQKDTEDPEMKQLGNMLDKILDIQHPGRVQEGIKENAIENKTPVFAVNQNAKKIQVTYLKTTKEIGLNDTSRRAARNKFYGTNSSTDHIDKANAIAAVIHASQVVTTGSTVKLRLLTDVYVNGHLISKGTFVFATASLENERLLLGIPGIREGNNLLPVSLAAYDMDGLAGVYIPGSISRDVAKQSADQSLQNIGMMSFDPSLKAQAATAGIQAAKGLLSSKVKLVKVTLKAGYQLLLKDENRQQY